MSNATPDQAGASAAVGNNTDDAAHDESLSPDPLTAPLPEPGDDKREEYPDAVPADGGGGLP